MNESTNPNQELRPHATRDKIQWLWYTAISLGLIALGWAVSHRLGISWGECWSLVTDRDALQDLIGNAGIYGPLVCIALQFIQVVIFFIPGDVTQVAAGLAFGTFWGFVYSAIGLILGSVFNFHVARWLGRPFVEKIVDSKTIHRVDQFVGARKGMTALALMFFLPGFPKDALCYIVGGVTSISYMTFFLVSSISRAPALLFSVMIGDTVGDENYMVLLILGVILGAFLLFRLWWKRNFSQLESP